jgi:hypothetical protein
VDEWGAPRSLIAEGLIDGASLAGLPCDGRIVHVGPYRAAQGRTGSCRILLVPPPTRRAARQAPRTSRRLNVGLRSCRSLRAGLRSRTPRGGLRSGSVRAGLWSRA